MIVVLGGVVVLAVVGWVASRQIKSPARIAADTAPPEASPITAQVQRRSLSSEVIVRGTGRFGKPQPISLPGAAMAAILLRLVMCAPRSLTGPATLGRVHEMA